MLGELDQQVQKYLKSGIIAVIENPSALAEVECEDDEDPFEYLDSDDEN